MRPDLNALKPTPASYLEAARAVEAGDFPGLRPLSVAIAASFTSEPLSPYLVVEGARRGLRVQPHFAPFNQLEQQLLDDGSALYAAKPDAVFIALRLEDASPALASGFTGLSAESVESELAAVEARVSSLLASLRRHSQAAAFIFNFAAIEPPEAGLADPGLELSQAGAVQRANERVAAVCRRFPGVYVLDCARLAAEHGLKRWSDPKLFHLWRIPFSAEAQQELGRRMARSLRAAIMPPCKCLVLDLDNTLWGGVLGEDGPQGIQLGEDYPGNVFKGFQRKLLALSRRGVLLAAASKNDSAAALAVLKSHPDCLLRPEHFAALQIHWNDKAQSLRAIARELNIGLDSLAFFDDSPVEREWIRSQLPEVTVIDAPESPLGYATALEESGAFDQLLVSAEDLHRAELYREDAGRRCLRSAAVSLEDFLKQLDMTATIGRIDKGTLPRVAQLLAKTNQFNLTTRRHGPAELKALAEGGAVALWLRVADRFGDNGLVGAAIAVAEQAQRWKIDTFLLSCRVIGRRVETALLSALCEAALKKGARELIGEYLPTPKNAPAASFYREHGFSPLGTDGRLWLRPLAPGVVASPPVLKLRFTDEALA